MDKTQIHKNIDKSIITSFQNGITLVGVINDLERKIQSMRGVLERDKTNLESIYPALINECDIDDLKNVPIRLKYFFYYVDHANKRISDIQWIIFNRKRFTKRSNSEVFKLMQLRDKLCKENSFPF